MQSIKPRFLVITGIVTTFILVLLLINVLSSTAYGAPLRGKLSGDDATNFRVLSLSKDGTANVADVSDAGRFKVNVRSGATLQLLRTNGTYFGPVVFPGKSLAKPQLSGKRGNVGSISLQTGFASVLKSKRRSLLQERLFKSSRIPFSSSGGTLGSGKLGLVDRTTTSGTSSSILATGDSRPGIDADRDGLPNAFDVDDDGDLSLDGVDTNTFSFNDLSPDVFSDLSVELYETLNLNAGGVSDSDIDSLIQSRLSLVFLVVPNTVPVSAVDLDCSNLPYCNTATGSAVINGPEQGSGVPFGSLLKDFDNNGDGFPDLVPVTNPSRFEIGIFPRVTTSDIASGDTYIFRVTTDTGLRQIPIALPYYFVTTVALQSYDSGSGSQTITYPSTNGDPGTPNAPIMLTTTSPTLTFWRPQRPAIPGAEQGSYIDMGGLQYGMYLAVDTDVYRCAPADFSNVSSELAFRTSSEDTDTRDAIFRDTAPDRTPNSANTLSFTVNLASCLARNGVSAGGKTIILDILANDQDQNNTFQHIHFTLPS
ncbi:MAG: hypothetical protein KDD70_04695 [Bdellovibrionales bacterium]|nr:hypothetical protein [Bdellovibrionales bacterium]